MTTIDPVVWLDYASHIENIHATFDANIYHLIQYFSYLRKGSGHVGYTLLAELIEDYIQRFNDYRDYEREGKNAVSVSWSP